jgi:uncharacterized protein (TIGR01244 family)
VNQIHTLADIYNYRRLSDRVSTSGQPTAAQLAAVAGARFEVVVNLAPSTDDEALPDESEVVEALGMTYEHIPVAWEQPTHADLEAFFETMARHEGRQVFVHCIANMRVSVFMALYRIVRLGWSAADAMPDIHAIWEPNPTWQVFMDAELARQRDLGNPIEAKHPYPGATTGEMGIPLRVHLAERPDAGRMAYLRTILHPRVELTAGPIGPGPARCEVLVHSEPTRETLAASSELRALIIPFTGVPPEVRELMREFPGVAVYNSHHPAQATAEVAFALLLTAAKSLIPLDRALRSDDWSLRYRPIPSVLLWGKTALILGYGAIGQRVARMCRGFDMRVMATRRSPAAPTDGPVEVYPGDVLHDLLPQADFLIVTLPLTDETRGVIGERELSLLPPHAVLVNVGRGPIVDERALYNALKTGNLGAAGLDVWYNYPVDETGAAKTPPSTYPFGELGNVVLSPHRGGAAEEEGARRARMEALADIINALARGEPAPNRVDLDRGY